VVGRELECEHCELNRSSVISCNLGSVLWECITCDVDCKRNRNAQVAKYGARSAKECDIKHSQLGGERKKEARLTQWW